MMATFAELLHDPEVEVRAAAGEGLALLYHASGLADGNYEGFEGFDDEPLSDFEEEEAAAAAEEQPDAAAAAAAAAAAQSPVQQQAQAVDLSPAGPSTQQGAAAGGGSEAVVLTASAVAAAAGKAPRRRDGDDMSLASCSSVSGLDLVVDRMKDLASNRGDRQRRSKRERSALKGAFRELRSVMEVSTGGEKECAAGWLGLCRGGSWNKKV